MSTPFGSDGAGDSGSLGATADGSAADAGGISGQGSENNSGAGNQVQNGAWTEALSQVPREFHPVLTPHLQKFDQNYGRLAQSFAPFKREFVDKGISPEDLVSAHNLYNMMNQNPQFVYEQLGRALGISPQQAQQVVQQQGQPQSGQPQFGQVPQNYNPGFDPEQQQLGQQGQEFDDPRLAQMKQQLDQMQNILQQQFQGQQAQQAQAYQQQLTDNYERQIGQGIEALRKKDPNFDVGDVLNRVFLQVSQDQEPNLQKAYDDHIAFVNKIRATPLNGAGAPKVMPTGGGMPPSVDTTRPKTTAEKAARVQQLIALSESQ